MISIRRKLIMYLFGGMISAILLALSLIHI